MSISNTHTTKALRAMLLAATMLVAAGGAGHTAEEPGAAAAAGTPASRAIAHLRRVMAEFALATKLADYIAGLAGHWAPHDDIEGTLKRTGEFVPRGVIEPPMISGDDAFSRDPAARDAARTAWKQFVADDEAEIGWLHSERDEQVTIAADLEQRVAHLTESLKKLRGARSDGVVDFTIGKVLGDADKVARERLPLMKGILENRHRIIRDYDALLARREVAHKGHVEVLHTIELIQGVRRMPAEPDAATMPGLPARGAAASSPGGARSVVDQRISERVGARALSAQGEAYQARSEVAQLKRETALIVRQTPPPTAGYSVSVQPQSTHTLDFRTEMRILPPERR
jgi:hypothetical protein